eukprot:UN12130
MFTLCINKYIISTCKVYLFWRRHNKSMLRVNSRRKAISFAFIIQQITHFVAKLAFQICHKIMPLISH